MLVKDFRTQGLTFARKVALISLELWRNFSKENCLGRIEYHRSSFDSFKMKNVTGHPLLFLRWKIATFEGLNIRMLYNKCVSLFYEKGPNPSISNNTGPWPLAASASSEALRMWLVKWRHGFR